MDESLENSDTPTGRSAEPGSSEPSGRRSRPFEGDPRRTGTHGRKTIPPKLYRIGEIVEYSGFSRQTIHNYTTMGLLTETRRSVGGHRMYDENVFAQLDLIEEMKRGRKSLREIRAHFAKLLRPR